jgi:superfamily II DNA/RNA helicase
MFKLILAKLNEIFKSNGFIETNKESVQGLLDLFKDIEDSMIRKQLSAEDENDISKIYLHSSEKFKALVHILLQNKEKKFFHSIVFTQTRLTAYYISIMLNEMAKLDEFSFIKVGHIYGDSKCAERFKEDSMNATKQVLINCF